MQKTENRKTKNTWLLVYFCVGQPWRHSLAKLSNKEIDWHFSFVSLTHSKPRKQHTKVLFIIGILLKLLNLIR